MTAAVPNVCRVCGYDGGWFGVDGLDVLFCRILIERLIPIERLYTPCLSWAVAHGVDPTFRIARAGFYSSEGYS